jgi:hypothetical protein
LHFEFCDCHLRRVNVHADYLGRPGRKQSEWGIATRGDAE